MTSASTIRWALCLLPLASSSPGASPRSHGIGEVGISAIQGRGHHSPLAGRRVWSSGIVTAVHGRTVHVQDPRGDGDPATSDAVLVAVDGSVSVEPGDRVRFHGTVLEVMPGVAGTANLSVTTVQAEAVEVGVRGEPLPRPVLLGSGGRWPPPARVIDERELPVDLRDPAQARSNHFDPAADALDFFESLEGMRVRVPAPVAVSPLQVYGGRTYEVVTLPDRGRGIAPSRRTRAGGILLRSGAENRGPQNTERLTVRLVAVPPPEPIAVGDRLGDIVGVLGYDFGGYTVAAAAPVAVGGGRGRPERTALRGTGTAVTVGSYNVHNLSATPEDSAQRALLGRQIVHHLGAPDILALQEIQDDSGELDDGTTDATGTLRALVDAVTAAGGPRYAFVDVAPRDGRPGGAPGGNIRNAFLYRPERVALVHHAALTPGRLAEAGVHDTMAFAEARDPLLAVFGVGERRLTVINNHLTSRYGSTPTFGAVQPFVQAGEAERAAQASALHRYVASLLARTPELPVVVLGDMNTFEFADQLARVLPGDPPILFPLVGLLPEADRYTYNFQGNSQALDHVFVTGVLRPGAALDIVHRNVDFPALPGPTASDHDPLVARVVLPGPRQ